MCDGDGYVYGSNGVITTTQVTSFEYNTLVNGSGDVVTVGASAGTTHYSGVKYVCLVDNNSLVRTLGATPGTTVAQGGRYTCIVDSSGTVVAYTGQTFALDLNFAASDVLDSRVTFTRASSATRFNSAGTLVTMTNDQPRFDYNPSTLAARGLLIEEARTNLLLRGAEFDTATWTKVAATITANSIAAPDGTTTMDSLVETAVTDAHAIYQNTSVSAGTHTTSVFVKAGTRNFASLRGGTNGGSIPWITVNLTTGAIQANAAVTSSSAIDCGGGIWRISVTAPLTLGSQDLVVAASDVATAPGTGAFVGNSYLGSAAAAAIYVWGAQLEAGAFATSYIPTVAATVTRAADSALMTGTNFSSWYNQSEGTFVAEYVALSIVDYVNGVFSVNNTVSGAERIDSRTSGHMLVDDNSVSQVTMQTTGAAINVTQKLGSAYKVNDFAVALNGGTVVTDVTGTIPTPTQLTIGNLDIGTAYPLNGWLKRLTYYNTRKTNAELVTLTA